MVCQKVQEVFLSLSHKLSLVTCTVQSPIVAIPEEPNKTLEGTPGKRPFLRQNLVPVVPQSFGERNMSASHRPPAWGTLRDMYGDLGFEYVASRDGLLYLRSKIDEALEKGIAEIGEDAELNFRKIRLSTTHPMDVRAMPSRRRRWILFAVILCAVGLVAYALWRN